MITRLGLSHDLTLQLAECAQLHRKRGIEHN
jgi:hypothetical protein